VFIYYTNATSAQYNNLKSILEDAGWTVSGSNSTTVSANDISNMDMVIDIPGNSNCGSNCRSVYDSYVDGGGTLIIAAAYGATNRISNIESLIENVMSVGSMNIIGGCNNCYGSVVIGDYASDTSSENTLPGPDHLFSATGGEGMAANSSTSTWYSWYVWDYGDGQVIVTFGYGQLLSTHTYADNMGNFIASSTSTSAPTPVYGSSGMTTAQTTRVTAAKTLADSGQGNTVQMDIDGSSNDIFIAQAGGPSYVLLSILGNTNAVDIDQDMDLGAHGYTEIAILGDSNEFDLIQKGSGDKGAFVRIDGDLNDVLVSQTGSGSHYLDLDIEGDSHEVDVLQSGTGDHEATIALDGSEPWNFELNQAGASNKTYTLPHTMTDGSGVNGTCNATGGCNLTIYQND
tara:strand:- start:3163 stop:4365 length:1203 start_codon:yes stop_codon:yes gene_type:complete